MHCLCNVRNICAHHGRLWNRRLTTHIKYPTNPINQFISDQSVPPYKLYSTLVIIRYFLNIINPDNAFNSELITLINSCSRVTEKEMGFPKKWRNEPFWV